MRLGLACVIPDTYEFHSPTRSRNCQTAFCLDFNDNHSQELTLKLSWKGNLCGRPMLVRREACTFKGRLCFPVLHECIPNESGA